MAAPPSPQSQDVVIRRGPRGTFNIGMHSGAPQIACATLEEALQRAGRFATSHSAQVWCTADGRRFVPLTNPRTLRKIWAEYVEMPGLRLTHEQAQRLWGLDPTTCTCLLESLIDLKFLFRGPDGKYSRRKGDDLAPPLRMAKADLKPVQSERQARPGR